LNLDHYFLIDQLKSRRDKKKRGSKTVAKAESKNTERLRGGLTVKLSIISIGWQPNLADHPDVIVFYVGDWDKSQTLADTGYESVS